MTTEIIELTTPAMLSPVRIDLPVWSAMTDVHLPPVNEPPIGRSALMVLDGLARALNVRIHESGAGVAISDIETGVFGTGSTLPDAVRDLRAALLDHLAILGEDEALSPNLRHQLELLRSYFNTP